MRSLRRSRRRVLAAGSADLLRLRFPAVGVAQTVDWMRVQRARGSALGRQWPFERPVRVPTQSPGDDHLRRSMSIARFTAVVSILEGVRRTGQSSASTPARVGGPVHLRPRCWWL